MMLESTDFRALLERERLVPVLRARTEAELREQVATSLQAGLRVVEITATSPGWEHVLAETARTPGVAVGAGTILTEPLARAAVAAGAEFLVAPCAVPMIRGTVEVPLIEGGFTPSEILSLAGPDRIVKLFPASTAGTAHLRALLDIAPGSAIMPTGGMTPSDAAAWIRAGALAVGLGSALTRLSPEEIRAVQRGLQDVQR